MSLFDIFRKKQSRSDNLGAYQGVPHPSKVDGLTPETAIKILPPQDPVKVRSMREAYKQTLLEFKPELKSMYLMVGPVEANRMLDSMIAEMQKTALLEGMLGKEGTTWKCGLRMYFNNDIQSQQIVFNDGKVKTLYFDFAEYHSLAEHIP